MIYNKYLSFSVFCANVTDLSYMIGHRLLFINQPVLKKKVIVTREHSHHSLSHRIAIKTKIRDFLIYSVSKSITLNKYYDKKIKSLELDEL